MKIESTTVHFNESEMNDLLKKTRTTNKKEAVTAAVEHYLKCPELEVQ